jgi:hypothetical protein
MLSKQDHFTVMVDMRLYLIFVLNFGFITKQVHVHNLPSFDQRVGIANMYEGCLKSSWTGGSVLLLCLPLHNSGALPLVHKLFKRPS